MTRASTLDLISLWMDSPTRRLDFALSVTLRELGIEALRGGAERARRCYPRADQRLDEDRWVAAESIAIAEAKSRAELAEFLHRPLDPSRECAVQQMVFGEGSQLELVTKSHHAAADLMSALMFLRAQLEGAEGRAELALRTHAAPVRKSKFAQAGPSTQLWTRRREPSGERRVLHVEIETAALRAAIAEMARVDAAVGFTFNDVLGAAALSMLRRFQEARDAETRDLSLWFPINVRADPWSGFGNGSSRIRIYGRHLNGTIAERARAFREQVAWSREHGEWAVPEQNPLLRLPVALRRPALRAYLRRPWVDMGTMLFSHVERLAPEGAALGCVDRIEIMSNLDLRHAVGLAAVTLGDRTQLSFTYDPALLDRTDVEEMAALFQEELCAA